MASSWQSVADQMNAMFKNDGSVTDTATKFQNKHGDDGKGHDKQGHPKGTPYKFGGFAVDVKDKQQKKAIDPNKEAKWLVDTGTRHFAPDSITLMENAIIDSLTKDPGKEIPITFIIDTLNPPPVGMPAYADVTKTTDPNDPSKTLSYTITIHCIP
jgi:hypothetical protein